MAAAAASARLTLQLLCSLLLRKSGLYSAVLLPKRLWDRGDNRLFDAKGYLNPYDDSIHQLMVAGAKRSGSNGTTLKGMLTRGYVDTGTGFLTRQRKDDNNPVPMSFPLCYVLGVSQLLAAA